MWIRLCQWWGHTVKTRLKDAHRLLDFGRQSTISFVCDSQLSVSFVTALSFYSSLVLLSSGPLKLEIKHIQCKSFQVETFLSGLLWSLNPLCNFGLINPLCCFYFYLKTNIKACDTKSSMTYSILLLRCAHFYPRKKQFR